MNRVLVMGMCPRGVAGTRLLDAKQGRLCQLFFNKSMNEVKNHREFGAILEQSYFHSVSCAILGVAKLLSMIIIITKTFDSHYFYDALC